MGRAVVVSFEEDIVRVIYARKKGKDALVDDALTLRDYEFDEFLAREKTKNFVVVNNFKEFFQDTLSLPITKKGILKKLVREEVRKRSDFQEFSFLYAVLGEKLIENARMNEVFVFAVKNDEIKAIADRFIQKGKTVKAMYPDIFSLASQVEMDEPVLCVAGTGLNKNLFLIEDKKIRFVRNIQSFESGLSDLDIQNINMTVNYCKQTFRINPSCVLLFGGLCNSYEVPAYGPAPLTCFPSKTGLFLDFASPISTFSATKEINILSEEYRDFNNLKLFLQYAAVVFALFSFLGLGHLGYLIKDITDDKRRLELSRRNIAGVESVLSSYESRKAFMVNYSPFLNDLREVESYPNIAKILVLISTLKKDGIRLDSISMTKSVNFIKLELKGEVKSESFANMQGQYEGFIKSIEDKSNELKNIKLISHSLELKTRNFIIEMECR